MNENVCIICFLMMSINNILTTYNVEGWPVDVLKKEWPLERENPLLTLHSMKTLYDLICISLCIIDMSILLLILILQKGMAHTLWIHFFGNLQSVRVGKVRVSRRYSQQQAVLLRNKLHKHVLDLVLDVCRLVTDRDFGHSRQIHQRQVQYWWKRELNSDAEFRAVYLWPVCLP